MSARNIEDIYKLSPMQQGMLFHSLYAPDSGMYFEQSTYTLQGALDIDGFKRAWQFAINRHPALRTAFMWEDLEEPLQIVNREVDLPFDYLDWMELDKGQQNSTLEQYLVNDRNKGFELSTAPLMRIAMIKIKPDMYYFVWSHHHLLLDGWSQPIIIQDVLASYEAYQQNRSLPAVPARSFREYIAWLQKQDQASAQKYWMDYLVGFYSPTPLPEEYIADPTSDHPMPEVLTEQGDYAIQSFLLDESLTDHINEFVRRSQLTLNTLFQGVWGLLLNRYSGEEDVVFGATVSGRPVDLREAESIVGLFINTLPIRIKVNTTSTVSEWLQSIQTQQVKSRQYEYTPLFDIQSWSEVQRETPLFESLLVFENYPVDEAVKQQGGRLAIRQKQVFTRTNYPLTIAFSPGKMIGIEIAYDCRRFSHQAIKRIHDHLRVLLEVITEQKDNVLSKLSILSEDEFELYVNKWNDQKVDRTDSGTLVQIFEKQVSLSGDSPAIFIDESSISYKELNLRANRLAHFLRKKGVKEESLVGILIERSVEMIVAILGVLKAGGAYIPLDPNYPGDRIRYMIKDSGMNYLISAGDSVKNYLEDNVFTLDLLAIADQIKGENDANLHVEVGKDNLIYVIYTSGSTGTPKGVGITQTGLVNHTMNLNEILEISPNDRMLQFISLSFDAAAEEIFPTLTSGASLVIPGKAQDVLGADLVNLCEQKQVTILHLPVPIWHQMLDAMIENNLPVPSALRVLHVGGEPVAMDKLRAWNEMSNEVRNKEPMKLVNAYGPTETTITATVYKNDCVNNRLSLLRKLPIGKPITNIQAYILDQNWMPVPIGTPGELFIGGDGLARGYLSNPGITAERFIPNPFNTGEQTRLYRTGDLVRYLPGGEIEFIGRVDFQVKLRGYRVELGEIETTLREYSTIKDAIVMIREDKSGDKRLVAYLLGALNENGDTVHLDPQEIRHFISERLPAYMIPAIYIELESFPLTPSGKIDRKAFPSPDEDQFLISTNYVAPRSPIEEIVAGLWAEILNLNRISIYDNFFELGGHSLKATQLLSRLRQTFEIDLALREVFENPTVAGIGTVISNKIDEGRGVGIAPPITPLLRDPVTGVPQEAPMLSFSQQRLWFLEQLDPGNLAWNIPLFVRISGELDISALSNSIRQVTKRHESLRTTFDSVDGLPVQIISPELEFELEAVDIPGDPEDEPEIQALIEKLCRDEVKKSFDLESGPLLRVKLLRLSAVDHVLILVLHHIIADGWSLSIFVNEVAALYQVHNRLNKTHEKDTSIEPKASTLDQASELFLPDLAIQYADFSVWQRKWLQGDTLKKQIDYWKEKLAGLPPVLDLPTDRPRPAVKTANGASESFLFPTSLSEKIMELSRSEGVTPYMFLLASFYVLLARYSGQDDICVGTAIANRTREALEGLIGFFVNTLVMRGDLSGDPTFRDLLMQTRETALEAYAHQDLPFEMLVEELQPERNLSYTPLFQVGFDYQDAQDEALKLPGITIKSLDLDSGTTPYDLLLSITHSKDGASDQHYLGGTIEFNTDLYVRSSIQRLLRHYQTLLEAIVLDMDQKVAALPILSTEERQEILVNWNETEAEFPIDSCIHQRFELYAADHPDWIALRFESEEVTYGDLNRKSNRLAHYLGEMGVGPDVLVGISAVRSPEMIIAILGVLKAGGAYLPLDPSYPRDRLEFMCADSEIKILLSQSYLIEHLPVVDTVVSLDQDWEAILNYPDQNPELINSPDSLAYVIYTSGSTGLPKGTMLRHRGLCNLAEAQKVAFQIDHTKLILQFSPFSFDASVWEVFMALANGGALCLARQDVLSNGVEFIKLLKEKKVTTVTLPPSLMSVLPEDQVSHEALPDLVTVIAAGEACTREIVSKWAPGRDFFNAYGPTETTVCASMKYVDSDDPADPPIGRPIQNTKLYILDKKLQPVPVGIPGELFVGGISVAKGYLNRPELTPEKFIPNPFLANVNDQSVDDRGFYSKLYKTGDLVRYRINGDIEFLGRIDHQVKLRGHRIELGEIEAALRECKIDQKASIVDGVVIMREDTPGNPRLVAYLITEEDDKNELPGAQEIRQHLRGILPEYMIPSAFVYLEKFPISPAGKVDRLRLAKLPPPDVGRQDLEVEYVAPRNEIETKLISISAELLGIGESGEQSPIGVFDNFFELGGHSLLATQFISRIRDTFNVELPLRILFEHPTAAEMALEIEILVQQGDQSQLQTIQRVSREERKRKRTSIISDEGND